MREMAEKKITLWVAAKGFVPLRDLAACIVLVDRDLNYGGG